MFKGTLNFSSSGNNFLSNTNQLKSSVNNNLTFKSKEFMWLNGIKNSLGLMVNYKYEINSIEKNHEEYFSKMSIPASKKLK